MAGSVHSVHQEIHAGLRDASPERLAFTRRAFCMLPALDTPRIIDMGCGDGGPTLELARLATGGDILALDIDQAAIERLSQRVAELHLGDRVRVERRSMLEPGLPPASADLIWAESSIHIIGFETGLDSWRPLLRSPGFLVVHDMAWLHPDPPAELASFWHRRYPGMRTVAELAAEVAHHGYEIIRQFPLPDGFWWREYFAPVGRRIGELRARCAEDDVERRRALTAAEHQVDLHRRHGRWYGSAFFVMRRTEP